MIFAKPSVFNGYRGSHKILIFIFRFLLLIFLLLPLLPLLLWFAFLASVKPIIKANPGTGEQKEISGDENFLDKLFTDDYSVFGDIDRMIDDIDKKILNIIQQDGRESNAEIARQVSLAPSAVLERVRKLEDKGVIRGYSASLDPKQVGFGLIAFVFVRTNECGDGTDQLLAEIPEVLEVHDVAGEDSYLLKVRASDPEDLARLLREKLKSIPTVVTTRTTVVLQTVKETTALPLDRCTMTETRTKGKRK